MLKLIEGGFSSGAHAALLDLIKKSVEDKKECFLFVPEQQTLSAEAEMCAILPSYAPRFFEVTNFTRFANTTFRKLGGICGKYCTGAESSLIMWRVLTELKDRLTMCAGRRTLAPGMVERALSAVHELQNHGVSVEKLLSVIASDSIKDARLRTKLTDLHLIYSSYKTYVSEKYNDLADDAAELAQKLEEKPEFLKDTHIYIDGFISFTKPQRELIKVMMMCTDVTVTLTIPRASRRSFEYTEVRETEKMLKNIARKEADVEVKVENGFDRQCYGNPTPTADDTSAPCPIATDMSAPCPEMLTRVADLLFATGGKIGKNCLHEVKKQGGRVRIFKAHDPFDECEFIAADIKRRVMESHGKEAYSSFAVIARNADKYVGIIDEAMKRAGIPYFISKKRDITSFEAIKLISVAYQVLCRGFRREDVLTYAKCGMCGISADECDELELYTLTWNIDGRQFTAEDAWEMNPRGYDVLTEGDLKKLERIEATRRRLIEPLVDFEKDVKAAVTVRDQATALYRFLSAIGLEESLYNRACRMFDLGELDAAEENARLWRTVCDSLDTLEHVLGDREADAEAFSSLLAVLFAEAGISILPLSSDQVTIGSADTLRIRDKRHVYLIGVNAGEFPQNVTDLSYFNERDKLTLKELELELEPNLEIKNARELYSFTRAFLSAKETVTLLYTEFGAAMDALTPSDVIGRIKDIFTEKYTEGGEEKVRYHVPIKSINNTNDVRVIDRIYSPADALMLAHEMTDDEYSDVCTALKDCGFEDIIAVSGKSPLNNRLHLNEDAAALLYGDYLYVSQSILNRFQTCPFSYYASYVLGLNETKVSELSFDIIGNFIHSVLERFLATAFEKKVLADGTTVEPKPISELTDAEKDDITVEASKNYIDGILGGGFGDTRRENAIARLRRAAKPIVECMCREFSNSRFKPVMFEISTSSKDPKKPDPLVFDLDDKTKVQITGKIDRIDAFKAGDDVYVRVIDYKSGKIDFKRENLEKGEYLQMFLYLRSVVETKKPEFLGELGVGNGGSLIPAGVAYVKTSMTDKSMESPFENDFEFVLGEVNERYGMVLDDETAIGAMSPEHMPTGIDNPKNGLKYSIGEWSTLCETVERVVKDITNDIRRGDIKAKPRITSSKSPCDSCSYKPLCRSPKGKKG